MSLRIKHNDMVTVISGNYKGARGRVLSVDPKKGTALVEGIRLVKKHQRARSQQEQGGILEREAPIALSKLMLTEDGGKNRAGRFATRTDENGNKLRVLKLRDEKKDVVV